MRYVKWTLFGIAVLFVAGFLHYTLPRMTVVRIVGTEVQRIQTGGSIFYADSETLTADGTRDVKIIQTIRENGSTRVYRNEDTGWGWPPYFKFNSADVQTRASELSQQAAPTWALVKSYGWRSQLLSIYPNAVSVKQVNGPDETPFPIGNILILALVAAAWYGVYRAINRFYTRRIDPVVDRVTDVFDGDDDPRPVTGDAPKKGFFARLAGRS